MLSALRTTAAQAAGKPAADNTPAAGGADFAQILQSSIDKVNQTQQGGQIKWRKTCRRRYQPEPALPQRPKCHFQEWSRSATNVTIYGTDIQV